MTNKVVLKTVDEFMSGYTPIYQPIFPLFIAKSKQYAELVGKITNRRLNAVGDIRSKHKTPKDTEIKQISSKDSSRVFKKYFLGSQYTESDLQDHEGVQDVVAQVLDEHNKHQDDLFFLGEGTSNSTMVNNGLFWSSDENYLLANSKQISKGTAADHLADLHTQIMADVQEANKIAGRKVLFVYGSTIAAKLSAVYSSSPVVFRTVLEQAMGPGWSIVIVPSDIALGNVNGWICVNMDQVVLHYTTVPRLKGQGLNDEEGHTWHNFLMGSMMLEVLVYGAIRRQPCTFEA